MCTLMSALLLNGCAGAMRNYHSEMQQTLDIGASGNIDTAIAHLEKNNTAEKKDILYFFEKSELLAMKGSFADALDARLKADEKIKFWEDESRLTAEKVSTNVSSLLVNDKVRRYDGRDYEKVMLSTRLVSNRLLLGQWNDARVEIKKMHERESIIAEVRAREVEEAEKEANAKGIKTTYKDLEGYPVEVLDDPELEKLKNSYENAFAHYLAGFMYESLGERSLAAAGYRKAIELRPNITTLEESLRDVDTRFKSLDKDKSDVLIVYESGLAPSYKSITIPVPLPLGDSLGITQLSFPVVQEQQADQPPISLVIDDAKVDIKPITDLNLMARKALKDELPGIITRSIVRATTKAIAQKVANENDSSGISGLAIMVGGFVMEGADERLWKTLPSHISVARAILKKGKHLVRIDLDGLGVIEKEIDITNRYTVLQLRKFGANIFLAQANSLQEVDDELQKEFDQIKANSSVIKETAAKKDRNDSASSRKRKNQSIKPKKTIEKLNK